MSYPWSLFLKVPSGAFSRPIQALFIYTKKERTKSWFSNRCKKTHLRTKQQSTTKEDMGFSSRTNLVRDEIHDEFSISSKGVGIGIGTRIDIGIGIGIERDLFPEIFESGRSITRTRIRNQRFNWSAEAPVPPFNRKHYQSRSHSSQEKLVLWVSFSSSQSTQTGPQKK